MGFTTGILMLTGLVVQHFLAKYLTIEEYGIYALMFSWIGLLSVFSLNSFNTIVTKATAQNYSSFFRTASKFCFLFSLLGSIALLIIGFFFESERVDLFILLAIFFPFYGGINFADAYFIGSFQFNKFSAYMISSRCLIAASQVFSVCYLQEVFWLLFFTLLVTSLINVILTSLICKSIENEKDKKKEKELIRYGIQLAGINLFISIANRIQYVLLAALAGTAVLSIYAVAQIIPDKTKGLIKSFTNPLSMYLASQKKEESIYITSRLILPLILFGMVICLTIFLLLPYVIHLIFGQKYYHAVLYSIILLTPIIFAPLNAMFGSIIIYHGYKKFYTILTIGSHILQIILFVFLIPQFQIWGVVLSVVSVSIISTLFNLIWFYRIPKPRIGNTILTMQKDIEIKGFKTIYFNGRLNAENFFKLIVTKSFNNEENYPLWVKITKICFFLR